MQELMEFKIISKHRLINHYYPKFSIAVNALPEAQLWLKDKRNVNSIGGIIVHVIEHIKRNSIKIKYPNQIFEKGIEDTFTDLNLSKNDLMSFFENAIREFEQAMDEAEEYCIYDIYHLIEHTGYHLGQVVDRSQSITDNR